jgi:hypothetical protein
MRGRDVLPRSCIRLETRAFDNKIARSVVNIDLK